MKNYKMIINGEKYEAKILSYTGSEAKVNVNGVDYNVEIEDDGSYSVPKPVRKSTQKSTINPQPKINPVQPKRTELVSDSDSIVAPIPGTIIDIKVKTGDNIQANQPIMIIEAMKMESEISSEKAGSVKAIHVNKGDSVQEGQILIEIGD